MMRIGSGKIMRRAILAKSGRLEWPRSHQESVEGRDPSLRSSHVFFRVAVPNWRVILAVRETFLHSFSFLVLKRQIEEMAAFWHLLYDSLEASGPGGFHIHI